MGRDKRNEQRAEHYTKLVRNMMETHAWRALSPTAQKMGVSINTAARAFHDLQAKGFLVVIKPARLGLGGEAKSPEFELTELGRPGAETSSGRKLYQDWRKGADYPVAKTQANNPKGANGKTKPCHQNEDSNVIKMKTSP